MLPSTLWNGCMIEHKYMQGKCKKEVSKKQSDDNEIIKNNGY